MYYVRTPWQPCNRRVPLSRCRACWWQCSWLGCRIGTRDTSGHASTCPAPHTQNPYQSRALRAEHTLYNTRTTNKLQYTHIHKIDTCITEDKHIDDDWLTAGPKWRGILRQDSKGCGTTSYECHFLMPFNHSYRLIMAGHATQILLCCSDISSSVQSYITLSPVGEKCIPLYFLICNEHIRNVLAVLL